MTTYDEEEAKNKLPELIDRALGSEAVVITRHGRPVVEVRPIPRTPRALTNEDVDWLVANRVPLKSGTEMDAGVFISKMRDEEDNRF